MKLDKRTVESTTYQSWQVDQCAAFSNERKAGSLTDEAFAEKARATLRGYRTKSGQRVFRCCVIWDHQVKGLGLRITPNNVRTWVLSYRVDGGKRMMKLGRYGQPLTIKMARDRAIKKLGVIADEVDRLEEKRERRRKAKDAKTISELCDRYMEEYAKEHKKTWRDDLWRINRTIKPKLGHIRVERLKKQRVLQFYNEISSRSKADANLALSLLRTMYSLAPEWGLLPEDASNPARLRRVFIHKPTGRDKPVQSDELPRLVKAIEEEPDIYVRTYFKLLLITGLRRNELARAKYSNLDEGFAKLRLPDTKGGKPRHVLLPETAVKLLRELPRSVSDYIFPSPVKPGSPRVDWRAAWYRVRKKAGREDLVLHDLRHTVATGLADADVSPQAIQAALGHHNIEQTMDYVHASNKAPRQALQDWADRILGGEK